MIAFRQALEDSGLDDFGFTRAWHTWEKGRNVENNMQERLDRRLATRAGASCFLLTLSVKINYDGV